MAYIYGANHAGALLSSIRHSPMASESADLIPAAQLHSIGGAYIKLIQHNGSLHMCSKFKSFLLKNSPCIVSSAPPPPSGECSAT